MSATAHEAEGQADCLVIGYYEWDFARVVEMTRAMGVDGGAYRDLRLAFIESDGRPLRAMDLINRHRQSNGSSGTVYHNYDLLWPPVAYLVTYLARRGLQADYVNLPHLQWDAFREKLGRSPLTVAITTTHVITAEPLKELLGFVRQHSPTSRIVIGGPFIYNQSTTLDSQELEEALAYIGADIYVISHEGEEALVQLIKALRTGQPLFSIPNLAFRGGQDAKETGEDGGPLSTRVQEWLEAHPAGQRALRRYVQSRRPAHIRTAPKTEAADLLKNRIDYTLFPRQDVGDFVSLWTSKSCPFACAFCGFPARGGAYRYLQAEDLARDFDQLRALGVTHLTFIDDTLNVPKGRFKQMLKLMIERGYGFRWNCFYRCDQGDAETVALMREAGCAAVFLGVESASPVILRLMNKTAAPRDYRTAIPMLREAGILTHANFIVGFPGETDDTVRESIELIEQTRPHTYRSQIWYCDPMTPIWKEREKFGLTGQSFNWRHDTMDARGAADWVDVMFQCVKGSTWLPQHSFEQWSILYLESKGVPRAAVFDYMRHFNAIIAGQLRGEDEDANRVRHSAIDALLKQYLCPNDSPHTADAMRRRGHAE